MNKKTLLPILLLLLCPTLALGQAKTTVSDTLRGPGGTLLSGIISIRNSGTFTSSDGFVVAAGTVATVRVVQGSFSVALIPNAGSNPAGTSYTAEYDLPQTHYTETWIVPSSASTVNLLAVRSISAPVPVIMLPISQINPPSPCTTNQTLEWNGASWVCATGAGSVTTTGSPASGNLAKFSGTTSITSGDLSGDVTTSGTLTTTVANLPDGVTQAGSLVVTDIVAPTAPAAAHLKLFGDSTDLRFHDKNAAGSVGTTVVSDAGAANNFLTAISTSGVISKSQPACANLSNAAASCSTDATNATNISSGTLNAARLPNPSATTLGGIESLASVAHQWINTISTAGVPSATQPACGDLSNAAASCSTDTTVATNISSGTLAAGRLPSTAVQTNQANTYTGGPQSLGSQAMSVQVANAGTTGTTINKLAKLTGAPGTAVITAGAETGGVLGIVVAGAGTTGSADIAVKGQASCVFDGATTANDYVTISSTSGDCHDNGATYPTGTQTLGRVLSTNGAGGTYAVEVFGPELQETSATGTVNSGTLLQLAGYRAAGTAVSGFPVAAADASGGLIIPAPAGNFAALQVTGSGNASHPNIESLFLSGGGSARTLDYLGNQVVTGTGTFGTGGGTGLIMSEGTCTGAATGMAVLCAQSSDHTLQLSTNKSAFGPVGSNALSIQGTSVASGTPKPYQALGTVMPYATPTLAYGRYFETDASRFVQVMEANGNAGISQLGVVVSIASCGATIGTINATIPFATTTCSSATSNTVSAAGSIIDNTAVSGHNLYFMYLGTLTNNLTTVRAGAGVIDTAATNFNNSDVGTGNYAMFIYSTSGTYTGLTDTTHFVCAVRNGTTQNAVSSGIAADTSVHRFEIIEDTPNTAFHFFIDKSEVCGSGITTDIPTANSVVSAIAWITPVGVASNRTLNFGKMVVETDTGK